MKTIRANLTFTFDEARVSERDIKDRLELILVDEFRTTLRMFTPTGFQAWLPRRYTEQPSGLLSPL
jgi:hypothetical protein